MVFFWFKFNAPSLSPVVKLDYFRLGNIVYLVYISVRDCNRSVICIYYCVAMRANGSGDIPSVVVPYGGG